MMLSRFFLCIAVSVVLFLSMTEKWTYAAAATIVTIEPSLIEVQPGSEVRIRVLVRGEEPLNAYALSLTYPDDLLEISSFDVSRSAIDVWQRLPHAEGAFIRFSGGSITPGTGETELLSILFEARKTGIAPIDFEQAEAYRADGKGTKADIDIEGARIIIRTDASLLKEPQVNDATPPVMQELVVTSDPFNDHQKLLGFLADDTGSGLKQIEMRHREWFLWKPWQPAINGASIPVGAWTIEVRARDNEGNLASYRVYDWLAFVRGAGGIVFTIFAASILIFVLAFRRRRMF